MLKLEKKARSREISISIREKKSFWTPPLIQAFALALFIHLTAVLVFRVPPFVSKESTVIFPPTLVNVDLLKEAEDYLTIADIELEKKYNWLRPATPSLPFYEVTLPQVFRQPELAGELDLNENPFLVDYVTFFDSAPVHKKNDFIIRIRKNDIGLLDSAGFLEIDDIDCEFSEEGLYCYQIFIEAYSGKPISWQLESAFPEQTPQVERLIQKVLSKLQFCSTIKEGLYHNAWLELSILPGSYHKIRCRYD